MQRCSYLFGSLIFALCILGMSALDDSSGEPLDYLAVPEYTQMLDEVVMNLDPLDGDSNGDSDGDSDVDFGIYLGLDRSHRECEKCVHEYVESALHRAEEEVHKRCEHPKCPYMKKACEEALKNKKALYGYLFAKLRAGAVAEAYCTGAQRCHGRQHADLKDSSFDTTPVQKRLAEKCEHPENARFRRFCEFRHKEPQIAAGMVYAYVAPYKYAMGYCMAARK
ncbi:hypothetical protein FOL47_000314 [Perkinsus chesapeaki]|uniref:Uncharacterized protein n=1 Tax=Perkinsus chesapeaki TaxID=330153 RepID=A0A7J6KXD7_PERCH|nr:hypothetical protein FOL47_000314 [Perkinsus chesapeaki]